jgi:hypothetical protein
MNSRTSLIARSALIFLVAPLAANAGNAASGSATTATAAGAYVDVQELTRAVILGKTPHLASANSAARPDEPTASGTDFDAQQHVAGFLAGTLSHRPAGGEAGSTPAATSSPVTARNDDLQAAARHLLQGQSLD